MMIDILIWIVMAAAFWVVTSIALRQERNEDE